MKTTSALRLSPFVLAAFAAAGANAEPPAAAAQEGVRLWEGGPCWADRNVGADEPWEPGWYFWWGDTIGYRRENGEWAATDGSTNGFSFALAPEVPFRLTASGLLEKGWTTADNVLAPAHDAARAHWGGDWRMPTKQELVDLCYNKCDWIPTTTNGVKGTVVRGRGDYADAGIFLPLAGWASGPRLERRERLGHLWASDPRADGMPGSWRLKYGSRGGVVFYHWDRFVGTTVRPVRGDSGPFPGHGTEAGWEGKENKLKPAGPACAPGELFVPASAGEPAAQKGVRLWEGGPLWADRNVGAETPSDCGWFFWWGDTVGYKREDGKWAAADGSDPRHGFGEDVPTFGKDAAALRREGTTTTNDVLSPAHDAARAHWGGAWRMPTKRELDDLCHGKCDWTWTTNGVQGFVVRGRGDCAGAAIFLPAAGFGVEYKWIDRDRAGYLWSSEPYTDGKPTDCTWRLRFGPRSIGTDYGWDRLTAIPVRPVRDDVE